MNIIAIYPSFKLSCHDSCVAVIKDNQLVYSYEENKLSRSDRREFKYLPDRALLSALYTTRIDPRKVDLFCICGPENFIDSHEIFLRIEKYFGITLHKIVSCTHHDAHAALAVHGSSYKKCCYFTLDGGGEDNCYGQSGIFDGDYRTFYQYQKPTLPSFYRALTTCCGFGEFEEGKVMGLSSYGRPDKKLYTSMLELFEFDDKGRVHFIPIIRYKYPTINWSKFSHDQFRLHKVVNFLHREICPELKELTNDYRPEIVAATGQKIIEDLTTQSIQKTLNAFSINPRNVAMGGGYFQNVILNQVIRKTFGFNIFTPPGSGDMGLAAGSALWALFQFNKKSYQKKHKSQISYISPYLGPLFSDTEVEKSLNEWSVVYSKLDQNELIAKAALEIEKGKIIGWFQGRGEFGARALGNRSVLADPRKDSSKARLNQLMKKRDWFMPFAPSILEESMEKFLDHPFFSPYMTNAFHSKQNVRKIIPAAIHVDGTVRPHIVRYSDNPLYYEIIKQFQRLTGVPMILNTSFNKHGVPIVATPKQAVEHLVEGVIDALFINSYHVKLPKSDTDELEIQTTSEKILLSLMSIRKGCSIITESKYIAVKLFSASGYQVKYQFYNKILTINDLEFDLQKTSWNEIGSNLQTAGIFPRIQRI
jgi:carbamoyltransferase